MNDLERYLKSEYRDPEFQYQELRRQYPNSPGWKWSADLVAFAGLCLLMVNLLYWSP